MKIIAIIVGAYAAINVLIVLFMHGSTRKKPPMPPGFSEDEYYDEKEDE